MFGVRERGPKCPAGKSWGEPEGGEPDSLTARNSHPLLWWDKEALTGFRMLSNQPFCKCLTHITVLSTIRTVSIDTGVTEL